MQKTLVLIKPDALMRGLLGKITSRFEQKGLKLVGMKMMQLDNEILKEHYSHIADKPFFPGISEFMQSSPVVAQCWEGKSSVQLVRDMCGVTNAREASAGTIRGDYALSIQCNVIHASEDESAAKVEVERFFEKEDIFSYEKPEYSCLYSEDEK
ncbi:nucleoside-diphosphate kinase [Candidatus Peregrinibacteria bacterium]|jgi:nucleoside-diphosphate kinase|nr:nucleoside-diphosphate kinase [Candidatus Peregrinibacteria bacterium]